MKKIKIEEAFFNLVVYAEWIYFKRLNHEVYLTKESNRLFNMDKNKWNKIPKTTLILKEKTFKVTGALSVFDMEILKGCGFEKKK